MQHAPEPHQLLLRSAILLYVIILAPGPLLSVACMLCAAMMMRAAMSATVRASAWELPSKLCFLLTLVILEHITLIFKRHPKAACEVRGEKRWRSGFCTCSYASSHWMIHDVLHFLKRSCCCHADDTAPDPHKLHRPNCTWT
jgi:hypothetical protein